jgi:hypothetical protein
LDNSYEYIIKQKAEGAALVKRVILALGYVCLSALLILLAIGFAPIELYVPLILLILAFVAFIAFVSWRFVCLEYEVTIAGGDLMITTIYGRGFSKKLLNRPINSFSEIGEYDDRAFQEISKLSLQKNYVCLSSLSAPSVYYALFEEEKDQCILYFDAPERAVEILKKSNSAAFRASDRRLGQK